MKLRILSALIILFTVSAFSTTKAQTTYRTDWFDHTKDWYLIVTTQTGMHTIDMGYLIGQGFPDNSVDKDDLQVFYNGKEIPIELRQQQSGPIAEGDSLIFFGKRNDGKDELWAYGYDEKNQANDYYSAYSDSSYYWVTYSSDAQPLRYSEEFPNPTNTFFSGYRDTVHRQNNTNDYYLGHGNEAELSTISESEGYYWYSIDLAATQSKDVDLNGNMNYLALVDSAIYVRSRFASRSDGLRTSRINLRYNKNGSIAYHTIGELEWINKGGAVATGEVSPVDLVNYDNLNFTFKLINGNSGGTFQNAHLVNFDFFEYSYFREFGFVNNNLQSHFYIRPDGFRSVKMQNSGLNDKVSIYLPDEGRKIEAVAEEDGAVFLDDQTASKRKQYAVVKNNGFRSPVALHRYQPQQDLLSSSNKGSFLILTRRAFAEEAQNYANYRRLKNNISTKVVFMDDVWRIFGYGEYIPVALRRFLKYAYNEWDEPPQNVFILADGVTQFRNSSISPNQIPPFGYPSSDSWFTMNFNSDSDWYPRINIGRLTARIPSEITAYLSKVSQYESNPLEYESWQKRITLLSGGLESAERQILFNHNKLLGDIANRSEVAADTILIGKNSNQPLDESSREDLGDIINNGTFLLHFFGHSSPDSWDLLTDNPNKYQNRNRLSVVLSLGCYSGLFAQSNNRVISEQFVMAPNAAVAFIGGSGQGNVSSLRNYSRYFYQSIFDKRERTLGDVDIYSRRQMVIQYGGLIPVLDLALVQNSMLLGDPAIRLALPEQPDYRFDFDPMSVDPDPTNLADSSFQVSLKIRNLGTRPDRFIPVHFNRRNPTGINSLQIARIPPVGITGNIDFTVDLGKEDAGEHEFSFEIDPDNELEEFDEFNNSYNDNHVVFSTGVDLIYPNQKGILTSSLPEFVLSTPSVFDGFDIVVELDSTENFSNPIATTRLNSQRVNIVWEPENRLTHGKEYFWRARVDKPDEINWRTASFLVDTTTSGTWWQQARDNFSTNELNSSLQFDAEDNSFSFSEVNLDIRTSTLTYSKANEAQYRAYPASAFVNGEEMGRLKISFYMIVINGLTGEIRNGIDAQGIPQGQHYDIHAGIFDNDGSLSRSRFIQDLNAVRPGDYVIIRVRNFFLIAPQNPLFNGPDDPLLAALRSVGAFKAAGGTNGDTPSQLSAANGYILFGKKFASPSDYNPDEVSEYIVRNGIFEADTTLSFNTSEGIMSSPLIGPVSDWEEIEGRATLIDQTGKAFVDVIGYEAPGIGAQRLTTINPSGLNSTFSGSISSINALQYPYIRLQARLNNPSRKTPQLEDWRVRYVPLPEIAIDPFSVNTQTDTLEVGYPYDFSVNVRNIGLRDADTVVVEYLDVFQPSDGNAIVNLVKRDTVFNLEYFNKPINRVPRTTRRSDVTVQTVGKQGKHQLQVRFSSEFLDQYSYNNYVFKDFFVREDTTAPTIEVFVDNRFLPPVNRPILDKENPNLSYVSTNPVIDIYWKDNNPHLQLNDTSLIEIRTFSSDPSQYTSYTINDPEITFVPANSSRNEAYVQFKPDYSNVKDSVITLQVLSSDFSGNLAEDSRDGYMISYRVSNQSGMTSFYPYPNPMSSFTNFAFELQGQNVNQVERLKIRMYTLSGRPVKSVDLLEDQFLLNDGRLRIGWNVYRWDGRDDDGDPLASGVYLYHVDFRADGQKINVNNSKSVEKIVILR